MKIAALLASALLPLGILAASKGETYVVDPREGGIRHPEVACEVIGVKTSARCRSGPDTKYEVVAEIKKGHVGAFTCVKKGECVVVDDFTNWYVCLWCGAEPKRRDYELISGA